MIKSTAIPSEIGDIAALSATLAGKLAAASNLSDLANAATARTNLSLGSVDNTSDANKPVSTAQQTALNLKANLASPALTGAVTIAGGTVTDPAYALDISQTFNDAADTFTAFRVNVTDTASSSGSKLVDAQVSGVSKFSVTKAGVINGTSLGFNASDTQGVVGFMSHGICDRNASAWAIFQASFYGASGCFQLGSGVGLNWRSGTTFSTGSVDTGVQRNAAGVLEVNNGTAGTLRDFKCRRATVTEYQEVLVSSEPSAPTSGVRLWADLSGGKVFLMARFPTGASQVVAQEP